MLSYHYDNIAKHESKVVTGLTSESARKLLFKDFGGKKALKVFERKEKMKVNVDVVKDQLNKTLLGKAFGRDKFELNCHKKCVSFKEIGTQKPEEDDKFNASKIEQDQQLEQMIPKMNKQATKLVDVYRIDELIEPNVLNSLDEAAVKLLKTPMKDLP